MAASLTSDSNSYHTSTEDDTAAQNAMDLRFGRTENSLRLRCINVTRREFVDSHAYLVSHGWAERLTSCGVWDWGADVIYDTAIDEHLLPTEAEPAHTFYAISDWYHDPADELWSRVDPDDPTTIADMERAYRQASVNSATYYQVNILYSELAMSPLQLAFVQQLKEAAASVPADSCLSFEAALAAFRAAVTGQP